MDRPYLGSWATPGQVSGDLRPGTGTQGGLGASVFEEVHEKGSCRRTPSPHRAARSCWEAAHASACSQSRRPSSEGLGPAPAHPHASSSSSGSLPPLFFTPSPSPLLAPPPLWRALTRCLRKQAAHTGTRGRSSPGSLWPAPSLRRA